MVNSAPPPAKHHSTNNSFDWPMSIVFGAIFSAFLFLELDSPTTIIVALLLAAIFFGAGSINQVRTSLPRLARDFRGLAAGMVGIATAGVILEVF
jgi:hypothetical protein